MALGQAAPALLGFPGAQTVLSSCTLACLLNHFTDGSCELRPGESEARTVLTQSKREESGSIQAWGLPVETPSGLLGPGGFRVCLRAHVCSGPRFTLCFLSGLQGAEGQRCRPGGRAPRSWGR